MNESDSQPGKSNSPEELSLAGKDSPKKLFPSLRNRNFRALSGFVVTLVLLVTTCSVVFQILMAIEGQEHSWLTGFYWTLTTMSTLGYGDVAFQSDLGRLFSIAVLLSGIIYMLVLLPFTFIELFYEPWLELRAQSRVPRSVPSDLSGHVILTGNDPVARALIPKLIQYEYPYVIILPELDEVLELNDKGINAIYGELDNPETYNLARVKEAAMVASTRSDIINTSACFTARSLSEKTALVATARDEASNDILKLAGCNRVLDLTYMMAEALARRAKGGDKFVHIVGRIDDLVIAEVDAARTTLVGLGYTEAQWMTSVSIVGFWARGSFEAGQQESLIEGNVVLVLAGSTNQLREFEKNFQKQEEEDVSDPVVIIGGGRVGRATAEALNRRGMDYRIVELLPERVANREKTIQGSAADKQVLQEAGIEKSPTVIITTRDDETNIYLTIYCRLIRPDIQLISRSTFEKNVAGLHRAGADIVMSYSSMGANALFNLLRRSDLLMLAEGLDVFKVPVPKTLVGKTIAEANIRHLTSCSVIGIDENEKTVTNPGPNSVIPTDGEIVLIGTPSGEAEFLRTFGSQQSQ